LWGRMENSVLGLLKQYEVNKRSAGLSAATIERVVLNVKMLVRDTNLREVEQMTTDLIIGWGDRKLSGGIGTSTLYAYYNSIRAFIGFVELLGIDHSVNKSRIKCRPLYKQRTWLRPGEIRHIINCSTPSIGVLIRLMYTSGMRISEAVSITDHHLQDGKTIYVQSKGGNMRPIFITKMLHEQLVTLATSNGGFCFVDELGEPLNRKKAYYYVKRACIKGGHAESHPHTFRHSFATELLRKGVSLSHTQRLMGHANVSITQIYEHLIVDDIERAHMKLTKV
jgi:site-specific recombinase XerD